MTAKIDFTVAEFPSSVKELNFEVIDSNRNIVATGVKSVSTEGKVSIAINSNSFVEKDWVRVTVDDFDGSNFTTTGSATDWVQVTLSAIKEGAYIPIESVSFNSYHYLVNGAGGTNPSGGFTCTGLDRLSDGRWIVGNDGRTDESSSVFNSSIVIITSDFSAISEELDMTAADLAGNGSVQGVCEDIDGNYWFCAKSREYLVCVDKSGELIKSMAFAKCNSIAYDSVNHAVWVHGETSNCFLISCDTLETLRTVQINANVDQMYYNSESEILVGTVGSNGTNGSIYIYDVSSSSASLVDTFSMTGAQAIEGVYLDTINKKIYLSNDGGFHTNANPTRNMIIEYDYTTTDEDNGSGGVVTNPDNDGVFIYDFTNTSGGTQYNRVSLNLVLVAGDTIKVKVGGIYGKLDTQFILDSTDEEDRAFLAISGNSDALAYSSNFFANLTVDGVSYPNSTPTVNFSAGESVITLDVTNDCVIDMVGVTRDIGVEGATTRPYEGTIRDVVVNDGSVYSYAINEGTGAVIAENAGSGEDGSYVDFFDANWSELTIDDGTGEDTGDNGVANPDNEGEYTYDFSGTEGVEPYNRVSLNVALTAGDAISLRVSNLKDKVDSQFIIDSSSDTARGYLGISGNSDALVYSSDYFSNLTVDNVSVANGVLTAELPEEEAYITLDVIADCTITILGAAKDIGLVGGSTRTYTGTIRDFIVNDGSVYSYLMDEGPGATITENSGSGSDGSYVDLSDSNWYVSLPREEVTEPEEPEEPVNTIPYSYNFTDTSLPINKVAVDIPLTVGDTITFIADSLNTVSATSFIFDSANSDRVYAALSYNTQALVYTDSYLSNMTIDGTAAENGTPVTKISAGEHTIQFTVTQDCVVTALGSSDNSADRGFTGTLRNFKVNDGSVFDYNLDEGPDTATAINQGSGFNGSYSNMIDSNWTVL